MIRIRSVKASWLSFCTTIITLCLVSPPAQAQDDNTTNTENDNNATQTDCLLNDNTIRDAVRNWVNLESREETEERYGWIENWNTSCVTNMDDLFRFTDQFQQDLTQWDVSRVHSMNRLLELSDGFQGNVSHWDTSNVRHMNRIFYKSSGLNVDTTGIATWNTDRLQDLRYGFASTLGLSGDLSGWNTSLLTDLDHLASDSNVFAANLCGWDLSRVTSLSYAFQLSHNFGGCISDWQNLGNVKDMTFLFSDSKNFTPTFDLNQWDTSAVTSMNFMFQGTTAFPSDLVAGWTTDRLQELRTAFAETTNFHGSMAGHWNTAKVTSFRTLFTSSINFSSPLIDTFDASNVEDVSEAFKFTHNFHGNLTGWKTSSLKLMEELVMDATDFHADISHWDVSRVTSMKDAFRRANPFPIQQIADWDTARVRSMARIFEGATFTLPKNDNDDNDDNQDDSNLIAEDATVNNVETVGRTNTDDDNDVYTLCWDLYAVRHGGLETITCDTTPTIGFDCDCIDYELSEVINAECPSDQVQPPCIGTLPIGDDDAALASLNANADLPSLPPIPESALASSGVTTLTYRIPALVVAVVPASILMSLLL